jgi:hypothetical protein
LKTGLFETEHFEVAYPMIRALDMPGNELFLFVNSDTRRRLGDLLGDDAKRYHWVVQEDNVSKRAFIWTMYRTCKKENISILFLNTVTAHFMLYGWIAALLKPAKVILTLHDANNFLRSRFSFHPRILVRHIGKKLLGRFCDVYITVSETMQHHIKNSMGVKKPVLYIPGAVFDKGDNALQSFLPGQRLRLAVPGSIDGRRRDYDKVFELLERINKQSLPIDIVLAGGPYGDYGQTVIDKCRAYNASYSNLIFYETPVIDQPVFDMAIDSCHFIWIPSVIKTTIADGIAETYGLTKSSGNLYDAVKHARPLLAPVALTISARFQYTSCQYTSIDALFDVLQTIIHSPGTYRHWSQEALANAKTFTIDYLREKLKPLY